MTNNNQILNEGEYIYALNMVNKDEESTGGELISEMGNQVFLNIPNNYVLIGSVEVPDKRVFLFLQHQFTNMFKIIESNTTYYSGSCFNYSTKRPIKGLFRKDNDNEILYFYDGEEPDRFINITKLDKHVNCESYLVKPNYTNPLFYLEEVLSLIHI